jgi:cell division protease FtsH
VTQGDVLSAGEFGRAFRAFLEEAVANEPAEEPVFHARLREHLGVDPTRLPIVTEPVSTIDHPNVQRALDAWMARDGRSGDLLGVAGEQKRFMALGLSDLLAPRQRGLMGDDTLKLGPVEYVNRPVGPDRTLACVQHGLYLLRDGADPLAVVVRGPTENCGPDQRINVEVMAAGADVAGRFIAELRDAMRQLNVYRGQVLMLGSPHGPFGDGGAEVEFLTLPSLEREGIILPHGVLELIERQTIGFARHAQRLLAAGRHLKRGLLLHGSPGTGKTLTAMYLVSRMPGRTVVVLSGRGYGLVAPSFELARNLQPAMVLLEDVDLVAWERGMHDIGDNPLLFELLNEMDGLGEDADVLCVLTTNRADLLEPALAARPGRIDQAIELPLPNAVCRRRLLERYGAGMDLRLEDLEGVVARTDGVSAAFIKELLRRAALLACDDGPELVVTDRHVDSALDELLVAGGRLNIRLLGGETPDPKPPTSGGFMAGPFRPPDAYPPDDYPSFGP